MNAALVRNILSLMILGFVLVIGFQTTALAASPFSPAAESCEHDCLLAQADCRDLCDDEIGRYQPGWYECRDACTDDYDQCILDCEPRS